MRRGGSILLTLVALLCAASPAAAAPPWQGADEIRADLFEAQSQLLFEEREDRAAAG